MNHEQSQVAARDSEGKYLFNRGIHVVVRASLARRPTLKLGEIGDFVATSESDGDVNNTE